MRSRASSRCNSCSRKGGNILDVNELSLDGVKPSLSTDVGALTDEDTAVSGTVADHTTDLTYSLVGDSPMGPIFDTDGTRLFEPSVLFDSLDTHDSDIVSLCRCVTHPNR